MTVLSSGTDNIVAQSGVTIATPDVSFTPVATVTYANQSVTYTSLNWTVIYCFKYALNDFIKTANCNK